MARTTQVKPQPKKAYRRTFIKQWRIARGLTQAQLAERVAEIIADRDDFSHASVGRIENGKQPYSQPIIEAIADALQTDVASLLMRDPSDQNAIWSVWEEAKPGEREVIVDMAESYIRRARKTGT